MKVIKKTGSSSANKPMPVVLAFFRNRDFVTDRVLLRMMVGNMTVSIRVIKSRSEPEIRRVD